MEARYTLTCDGCGEAFYSSEAFPNPQYCLKCAVIFDAGLRKGRREVVEFCKQKIFNTFTDRDTGEPYLAFRDNADRKWQAQLEEWGLKEEN